MGAGAKNWGVKDKPPEKVRPIRACVGAWEPGWTRAELALPH